MGLRGLQQHHPINILENRLPNPQGRQIVLTGDLCLQSKYQHQLTPTKSLQLLKTHNLPLLNLGRQKHDVRDGQVI
jgi:hypothetical protein